MQAFLLTTTHHVLAFDGEARFVKVHSGKGLYYGLARNGKHIYVSCRDQGSGPYDAAHRTESGCILVFDADSLRLMDELRPEDFPLRDVHGIAYFDSKLWVTSSFDNLVAVFDPARERWSKWYASPDATARDRDVNHFNSIVPDGRHICVLAHNHGPSEVMIYDRFSLEFCSRVELGTQAHDIFRVNGSLGTCSSGEGVLTSTTGWTVRTGAFPRGLTFTDDRILVGISQIAPRAMRAQASGVLRQFTPRWEHTADHVLPGVGMVLAILPVEVEGRALSRLEDFEAQTHFGEYNALEPGNVYSLGSRSRAVVAGEWHESEKTHRWTAALRSRMRIIVNPGETTLSICTGSGFTGPFWTEVWLNGKLLGSLHWCSPGEITQQFPLPAGVEGSCELTFQVPQLWQPSSYVGTADDRMLGVSVKQVRISGGEGATQDNRVERGMAPAKT